MNKTIIVLITLALIAAMLFSFSSTQQESSLAESLMAESSAAESESGSTNPEFPDGYPDHFSRGEYSFERLQDDLFLVTDEADGKSLKWLWNCKNAIPESFPAETAFGNLDICINKGVVLVGSHRFFGMGGEYFGAYGASNPIDNISCNGRLAQYAFIDQTDEKRVGYRL